MCRQKILLPTVIHPPFTTLTQSLSLRQSSNSWRSPLQGRGLLPIASSSVSSIVSSDGWGLCDLLRMRIYCKQGTSGETRYQPAMRFNHRELSLYASSRLGKADKEGCLWVKEWEGILRKKESECNGVVGVYMGIAYLLDPSSPSFPAYTQRWFLLTGNLLFYCRTEHPVSEPMF